MTEEESAIFLASMADVIPLNGDKTAISSQIASSQSQQHKYFETKRREALSRLSDDLSVIEPVAPDAVISMKSEGVQQQVFKLFRQGQYSMQADIDLKGYNVPRARELLFDFIQRSLSCEYRNVIVIHGTGVHNKPFPALIKSCLAHWLPLIDGVIGYHSAPREWGGSGALMVMLTKSEKARMNTRELTRKGAHLR